MKSFSKIFIVLLLLVPFELTYSNSHSTNNNIIPFLKFEDASITSVLNILSQYSKKEIVASSTVLDKITIQLKNKTWKQALDTICNIYKYSLEEETEYYFIIPKKTAKKTDRKEFRLSYISVNKIKPIISNLISDTGTISVDSIRNSVFIHDNQKNISSIEKVILEKDTKPNSFHFWTKLIKIKDTTQIYDKKIGWIPFKFDIKHPEVLNEENKKFPSRSNIENITIESDFKLYYCKDKEAENLKELTEKNKVTITASSKTIVKNHEISNIFLGKQIPIRVTDKENTTNIKLLKSGIYLSVLVNYLNYNRTSITIKVKKISYIVAPTVGIIPQKSEDKVKISTTIPGYIYIRGIANNILIAIKINTNTF